MDDTVSLRPRRARGGQPYLTGHHVLAEDVQLSVGVPADQVAGIGIEGHVAPVRRDGGGGGVAVPLCALRARGVLAEHMQPRGGRRHQVGGVGIEGDVAAVRRDGGDVGKAVPLCARRARGDQPHLPGHHVLVEHMQPRGGRRHQVGGRGPEGDVPSIRGYDGPVARPISQCARGVRGDRGYVPRRGLRAPRRQRQEQQRQQQRHRRLEQGSIPPFAGRAATRPAPLPADFPTRAHLPYLLEETK